MRVAIVHDWLTIYAGAERVLAELLRCFPKADIFTVVDFLPEEQREFLNGRAIKTTFIQRMPFARSKYRSYLPLMPIAVEQLDLSAYDLVISSSHAVAKGVITHPNQKHISYIHSPMRYAWDLQHQYLEQAGLTKGPKSWLARYMLHKMRLWDVRTVNGVDAFVANSHYIGRRIWKVYRREAKVIYPPVDVKAFSLCEKKEDYYLAVSRMVPYKRMDLIVSAFSAMPEKRLIVIGDGPQMKDVRKLAGSNVTLLGAQPFESLLDHMQRAKAFVFAAEEDFGIAPVEAQACGTPVIAYGKGGALETVRDGSHPHPTGLFFPEQTVAGLTEAVRCFEQGKPIKPGDCRKNAVRFSPRYFRKAFLAAVDAAVEE